MGEGEWVGYACAGSKVDTSLYFVIESFAFLRGQFRYIINKKYTEKQVVFVCIVNIYEK